jgi:lipopolysaccharide export system permease protein|tara:strand:- start:2707 stop:3852 length:1146 start_codon:yes stop_codon:yes gene_type:complete
MLKNKIYKYFTVEILKSFIVTLFALSAVAWTVRAVSFLDLVVENGHSVSTYLLFSLFNMTNIVTKFIPLSFLLALVLTILKFEKQNELMILWTTGLSKMKLVNLFFYVSLIIFAIQITFAVFITPQSLHKSRNLIAKSDFNSMSSVIRANDFSDSFKGITFYVEKKNVNNEMENIFIRDENNSFKSIISNEQDSSNTTIIAEKGVLDSRRLILINGVIQTQNLDGEINNINFSKTELAMNLFKTRTITKPKLQETFTSYLIKCLIDSSNSSNFDMLYNCPKHDMKQDITSTLLRRVGMPIYIPLVSLICSFLLISFKSKKYKNFNKYIFFSIAFFVLVLAEILVRFSGFSNMHSLTYFLFPIILMPILYFMLNRRFSFEQK